VHPAAEAAYVYDCYSVVYDVNAWEQWFYGTRYLIWFCLDLVLFVCVDILLSCVCRHLVSVLRVEC